jgi:hypothetical protein
VEVVKPGSRAQHSRVERLLWADKTVMFRVFAVVRAMDARKGARVEMRILTIYGLIWVEIEIVLIRLRAGGSVVGS